MSEGLWIAIAVVTALVIIAALILGLVLYRRRRISLSARPELPVPLWASVSFFVPMALPSATEATTKTIQPITAVFQWRALQRPARAVMLIRGGLTDPPELAVD